MNDNERPSRLSLEERNFAKELRRQRLAGGMNQKQFADRLATIADTGIDQAALSRIESERRVVRMIEAQAIAELLGTTVWAMMHPDAQDHALADARRAEQAVNASWDAFREALDALQSAQMHARVLAGILRSSTGLREVDGETQLLRDSAVDRLEYAAGLDPAELTSRLERARKEAEEAILGPEDGHDG